MAGVGLDDIGFDCSYRYEFETRGELHNVEVEHKSATWRILSDSSLVATKTHGDVNPLIPQRHTLKFLVKTGFVDGLLQATLTTTWAVTSAKWCYDLRVHGTKIKPVWSKKGGQRSDLPAIEVLGMPEKRKRGEEVTRALSDEEPAMTMLRKLTPPPDKLCRLLIDLDRADEDAQVEVLTHGRGVTSLGACAIAPPLRPLSMDDYERCEKVALLDSLLLNVSEGWKTMSGGSKLYL